MNIKDMDFLSILDVQDALDAVIANQVLLVCLDREIAAAFNWENPELSETLSHLRTILDAYDSESVLTVLRKCSERLNIAVDVFGTRNLST